MCFPLIQQAYTDGTVNLPSDMGTTKIKVIQTAGREPDFSLHAKLSPAMQNSTQKAHDVPFPDWEEQEKIS